MTILDKTGLMLLLNKCRLFRHISSVFLLICFIATGAYADTSFTLTVNNAQPVPGETVLFSSNITGASVDSMLTNHAGITVEGVSEHPPIGWSVQIPVDAAGQMTFQAYALIDKVRATSNPVTITVVPDQTKLDKIFFWPGRPLWLSTGKAYQLQVRGSYLDGEDRVLTTGATGTVYTENIVDGLTVTPGDSPSISVSGDGLLMTIAPGTAEVVATNNGNSAMLRVFVQDVIPGFRISGSAYNFPESATYRATYTIDVTGSATPTGSVSFYYAKTRLNFVSSYITDASKDGIKYTISGIGAVNGVAGYSFTTTFSSDTLGSLGMEIRKPDNTVYFTAAPKSVASGKITVTQ
jgi:hypothetical protein